MAAADRPTVAETARTRRIEPVPLQPARLKAFAEAEPGPSRPQKSPFSFRPNSVRPIVWRRRSTPTAGHLEASETLFYAYLISFIAKKLKSLIPTWPGSLKAETQTNFYMTGRESDVCSPEERRGQHAVQS